MPETQSKLAISQSMPHAPVPPTGLTPTDNPPPPLHNILDLPLHPIPFTLPHVHTVSPTVIVNKHEHFYLIAVRCNNDIIVSLTSRSTHIFSRLWIIHGSFCSPSRHPDCLDGSHITHTSYCSTVGQNTCIYFKGRRS